MFCPNCASPNDTSQRFCRTCGLKLDAIIADLAEQKPSPDFAKLLERKRHFEMAGFAAISAAAMIGVALVVARIFIYKLLYFGDEFLFKSALFALLGFLLASVALFAYTKLMMRSMKRHSALPNTDNELTPAAITDKLLPDPTFKPASVTEHTTELLKKRR